VRPARRASPTAAALYAGGTLWHLCGVRFPLPVAAFVILAFAGCATSQPKTSRAQKKLERQMAEENTRFTERRRMSLIENGKVDSLRGAAVVEFDPSQSFDPNANTAAAARSYGTKGATTKDYYTDKHLRIDAYQTRDFYDKKTNSAAERKFATAEANTKGKYGIPNAGKAADTKTAATKESSDANKVAASRDLPDGGRQYLGPEHKKLGTSYSAKDLANWRTGESIDYSDGVVNKAGSFKALSIDDIRDLLNKTK
jgi:hypothetical protein